MKCSFSCLWALLCLSIIFLASGKVFSQNLQVVHDSVRLINTELVIRNSSRSVQGYLYNTGNGITQFRAPDLARNIQFKTGQAGYPVAGDTVYTDASLIGRTIIVWRNGLLQYQGMSDGIAIDGAAGKVFFRPALQSGDRIYIEGLNGVSMVF
jgi:hypothetical protein